MALVMFGRQYLGIAAVVSCLLAIAATGCATPEERHKVLATFFDGVPDLDWVASERGRPLTAAELVAAQQRARLRAAFKQPTTFIHAPRASNECDGCHEVGAGPRLFGRASTGDTSDKKQITPKLARPISELCLTCHSDKSGEQALALGLRVHQPVADGQCVGCHHPHSSARQYMLLGEDSIGLCMTCHTAEKKGGAPIAAVHAENPGKDCLECHNAHVGKTERLLKADFDEWLLYEPGP